MNKMMHTIVEIASIILICIFMTDAAEWKKPCQVLNSGGFVVCAKTDKLVPEDLVFDKFAKPSTMKILNITQGFDLKIPDQFKNGSHVDYAYYKEFIFENICLKSIEDKFFSTFNGFMGSIERITFTNVKCMKSLRKESFFRVEDQIKELILVNLPDLEVIEDNFFQKFDKLKTLKIENTKIRQIDVNIQKMSALRTLKLTNNQIETLTSKFIVKDNFDYSSNPFKCNCLLDGFIRQNKDMFTNKYTCSNGSLLMKMGNLCIPNSTYSGKSRVTTKVTTKSSVKPLQNDGRVSSIKKNNQQIQESSIKLEVIIPTVIVIVAVLVVLAVLVVMKRRKDLREQKYQNVNINSPSVPVMDHKKALMDSRI